MQFFRNLFHPFFNAFCGEFRLAIFINGQTQEVIVIRQAFRG